MEQDLIASKPSIRSGGFTMGGPRNSVSNKSSIFNEKDKFSTLIPDETDFDQHRKSSMTIA